MIVEPCEHDTLTRGLSASQARFVWPGKAHHVGLNGRIGAFRLSDLVGLVLRSETVRPNDVVGAVTIVTGMSNQSSGSSVWSLNAVDQNALLRHCSRTADGVRKWSVRVSTVGSTQRTWRTGPFARRVRCHRAQLTRR